MTRQPILSFPLISSHQDACEFTGSCVHTTRNPLPSSVGTLPCPQYPEPISYPISSSPYFSSAKFRKSHAKSLICKDLCVKSVHPSSAFLPLTGRLIIFPSSSCFPPHTTGPSRGTFIQPLLNRNRRPDLNRVNGEVWIRAPQGSRGCIRINRQHDSLQFPRISRLASLRRGQRRRVARLGVRIFIRRIFGRRIRNIRTKTVDEFRDTIFECSARSELMNVIADETGFTGRVTRLWTGREGEG